MSSAENRERWREKDRGKERKGGARGSKKKKGREDAGRWRGRKARWMASREGRAGRGSRQMTTRAWMENNKGWRTKRTESRRRSEKAQGAGLNWRSMKRRKRIMNLVRKRY